MAPAPLLPFQRQILDGLLDENALCVVARGLGLERILGELGRACATPQALVFLLNASDQDEDSLKQLFMQMRSGDGTNESTQLQVIKNETNSAARAHLYRKGGLVSVTSRILVVDLLNKLVPVELTTGIIVCNASRVSAESIEAFILRLVRQQNPRAFVKALSDAPEAFTMGFAPLEKTLRVLGLRHVHLWPRFHVAVQRDLSEASAPVVELRQPQTRAMVELQQAALDCVAAMISELCSSAKVLDSAEINVEASLFRYFDAMIKRQLAPYWHRLSGRVRGMVADLASLRRVAELITAYDCVSLQRYLDTLLISNKPGPGSSSAPATWLASDSANILFAVARARLFHRVPADQVPEETKARLRDLGLPENIAPVLEVPPKLQLLAQILDEIGAINHGAAKQGKDAGPVLIMAGSSRECRLIRSHLVTLNDSVRLDVPGQEGGGSEHPRMMVNLLRGFFKWKAQMARPEKPAITGFSAQAQARSAPQTARPAQPHSNNSQGAGQLRRSAPPTKRRRTRGASTASSGVLRAPADKLEQESAELAATINSRDAAADNDNSSGGDLLGFGMPESQAAQDPAAVEPGSEYLDDDADEWAETLGAFDENFGILPGSETLIVQSYSDSLGRLEALRPTHIVMYDPDPAFIREIELYQAHGGPLKQVYFMVYDNSIEEQRYLSSIRREREAFEKMIRDKATMVIPIGANAVPGISALVGGGSPGSTLLRAIANRSHRDASTSEENSVQKPTVVVDVREFRSPLPSFLHAAGFDVVPRTIDIGDYILHDNLVVERKSLPDLIGSLRSGRLYNQAEAMTNHYTYAALLIEFEVNTSFSLQAMGGLTADIQFSSINSQLTMLVLAFPRLRILWSCSPYETVNIFVELKRNSQEPDIDRAVTMGQDDSAVERESIYSQSAITLLQSLPGVTLRNYQALAKRYKNIREMCAAKKEDLDQLLGNESAIQLYQFLHANTTTQ